MTQTEPKPLRYFSYSRAAKDEHCERALYYHSEWGGTGLEAVSTGWDLVFGNFQHKYLNQLALNGSIDYTLVRKEVYDEALKAGLGPFLAQDYTAVAEGQLRAFTRYIWPRWLHDYSIRETEAMRQWEVSAGYVFRFRQDILLQSKVDGHLMYPDYKTTSSNSPQWIASWAKSVQLHSSMYAMRKGYGIEINRAVVPGFYKGYKDKKDGSLRSVYAYGYVNREYPMNPQYSYEYTRSRGWEKFSTFDEFPDLSQWVANMPEHIIAEQFPTTGPIFPRNDIAEKYFKQQMIRQGEIAEAVVLLQSSTSVAEVNDILDKYFRQDFSNCEPAYGYPCEFRNICWIPWVEADPIDRKSVV